MKQRTAESLTALAAGTMAFIMFFMLFISPAHAGGVKEPEPVKLEQHQGQAQQQHQEQGQSTTVTTGSVDVANEITTNTNATASNEGVEVTVEGDAYEIPVSTAYAPPAYSRIGCDQYFGFGATRSDGSMSVGIPIPRAFSRKIKDCQRADGAAWMDSIGQRNEAIEMRCETKVMVKHYGTAEDCVVALTAPVEADELARLKADYAEMDQKHTDVVNLLLLERSQKAICNESLERCTEKAYGGK